MSRGRWLAALVVAPAALAVSTAQARGEGCPEQVVPLGDVADGCVPKALPDVDKVPDVGSLKTPESPAFMALGIAPTEIQRPATPAALVSAFSSGFAKGGRIAPAQNFALQVNPYWLVGHPKLTADDLESQWIRAIYRNISFSAATAGGQVDVTDAAGQPIEVDVTRTAVGLRTTLLAGFQSAAAARCQRFLVEFLDQASDALASARAKFASEWDASHPEPRAPDVPQPRLADFPGDLAGYQAAIRQWDKQKQLASDAVRAEWKKARVAAMTRWLADHGDQVVEDPRVGTCLATIHERVGPMAEVAGAYVLTLPDGDLDRKRELTGRHLTGWLTLGYVHKVADGALELTLLAAGRLEQEKGRAGGPTNTRRDAGGRLVAGWRRYGLSLEASRRWQRLGEVKEQFNRFAIGVDYRVAGGAWLNFTYGQDFGTGIVKQPLIALANLQWNIGLDRGVRPDTVLTRKSEVGVP